MKHQSSTDPIGLKKLLLMIAALGMPGALHAKEVFLNGVDISSVKNQRLENVTISIDAKGDISIEAPHYQVHEQRSYEPLRKKSATPAHSSIPKEISNEITRSPVPIKSAPAPASAETEASGGSSDSFSSEEENSLAPSTKPPPSLAVPAASDGKESPTPKSAGPQKEGSDTEPQAKKL
jgi:hypothetical protein